MLAGRNLAPDVFRRVFEVKLHNLCAGSHACADLPFVQPKHAFYHVLFGFFKYAAFCALLNKFHVESSVRRWRAVWR